MNAPFNSLDFIHRLEREGLARGAAEAIAGGSSALVVAILGAIIAIK